MVEGFKRLLTPVGHLTVAIAVQAIADGVANTIAAGYITMVILA